MGFIHMLLVNKRLNVTVKGIHGKFHRLEDLINGYRGVNAVNFDEANTIICSIYQAKLFVNEFKPEYYI